MSLILRIAREIRCERLKQISEKVFTKADLLMRFSRIAALQMLRNLSFDSIDSANTSTPSFLIGWIWVGVVLEEFPVKLEKTVYISDMTESESSVSCLLSFLTGWISAVLDPFFDVGFLVRIVWGMLSSVSIFVLSLKSASACEEHDDYEDYNASRRHCRPETRMVLIISSDNIRNFGVS
jgi:hypothetical protein